MDRIEKLCAEKGMRMTDQRRVIARVLSSAKDHPDVEELASTRRRDRFAYFHRHGVPDGPPVRGGRHHPAA